MFQLENNMVTRVDMLKQPHKHLTSTSCSHKGQLCNYSPSESAGLWCAGRDRTGLLIDCGCVYWTEGAGGGVVT